MAPLGWHSLAPQSTLLIYDLARASVRNAVGPDSEFEKASVIAAVERMARADRRQATELSAYDAHTMIFNAVNGTIDLTTGELLKHNTDNLITKRAACEMAPVGSEHPLWSAFLDRIFDGNVELQQFIQRWFGYCLTGSVLEHAFVFGHGSGGNGKGTMLNTIAWIFSDYATVADMGTLIASKSERHPTDIAKLHGARLVTAQETQQGRQGDEAKIKAMTGGDRLTGRFIHQDFFDFEPTFKLFVAGNHMPTIENVDYAMQRQFNLVPFNGRNRPRGKRPSAVKV